MAGLDPYRRIPGETYSQRMRRLKAETGNTNPFTLDHEPGYNSRQHPSFGLSVGRGGLFAKPSPQGADESNISAGIRNLVGNIANAHPLAGVGDRMGAQAKAVYEAPGRAIYNLFNYAADTPAKAQERRAAAAAKPQARAVTAPQPPGMQYTEADRIFNMGIIGQESGGRQLGSNGQALVGHRADGSIPASGPAFGAAQMQEATARGVAAQHGIPFDKQKFLTDREYNLNLGRLHFRDLYTKYGDAAKAIGAYHSGEGNVDRAVAGNGANWLAGLGPEGRAYVPGVQRRLGDDTILPAQFLNPFDPSYGNKALGEVDRATAAAMKPETNLFDVAAAPELPKPEAIPLTDFSKADAALQAMKPVEMTEYEKLKMQREGYFKGLGQALLAMPEGAGLGRVLAMAGGGALAGVGQAKDEIRQRQDQFEAKMAQYNAAVYSQEMTKATTLGREMQAQVQQNNAFSMQKWQIAYDQYKTHNQVDVTADAVISRRTLPNGQMEVRRIPFSAPLQAAGALQRAQIFQSMGSQANAGNAQVTAQSNNLIAGLAAQAYTAGEPGGDEALVAAPVFASRYIVDNGLVEQVLGAEGNNQLRRTINARMAASGMAEPLPGGDEAYATKYREKFDEMLTNMLSQAALSDPQGQVRTKIMAIGGGGAAVQQAARRFENRRERTSTDTRGRTSRSATTYVGEEE